MPVWSRATVASFHHCLESNSVWPSGLLTGSPLVNAPLSACNVACSGWLGCIISYP